MPRRSRRRSAASPAPRSIAALLEEAKRAPLSGTVQSIDAAFVQRLIVAGQYTRARACDGKVRFGQYHHAEKARSDIAARFDDSQVHVTYPCPFCGGFHLATAKEFI